ncbi:aspartyl/asparaginyl beta-hydroxylase isoform X2, partial [Silurus asotus]
MTHEPESTVAPEVTPEIPETSKPQSTSKSAPKPTPGTAPETEVKKTKPNLLNKSDKKIKSEINAAEKLRKKGKVEEALQAFEALAQKYPQSPRSRYGKAQAEDDMAEKLRSNEMLLKAVNTYREAAELSDAPADLIKAALKRSADRQQFL